VRRLASLIAIGCSLAPIICQASFFGRRAGEFLTLEEQVSYRTDLPRDGTIEQVISQPNGWTSQSVRAFPATKDPVDFWAKFDLPRVTETRSVLLDSSPWEHLDFYFVRDGRVISRQTVGTLEPSHTNAAQITMTPLFSHSGFAAVDLMPNSQVTVFAHIQTTQRFEPVRWLRFYVWDAQDVRQGERRDRLFQGIYLGIIFFLVAYNLGLFIAVREWSYLDYVIFESAAALFWSSTYYGLTSEYLWPNYPTVEFYVPWFAFAVSSFSSAQFLRHFLDTRKFLPKLDVVVKWTARSALIFFVLPLLSTLSPAMISTYAITLLAAWVLSAMVVFVGVMIVAYMHKHPLIKNVFAAMLCSAIGAIIGTGAALGWFKMTDLTLHAPQIGSCLTGIVLSIGLGFRFRNLETQLVQKQVAEAQTQSAHEREKRELIEKQREHLEQTVRDRTAELVNAQQQSDALLANILPSPVIEELKLKGEVQPRRHDEASILFADFAGFTEAVATIPPKRLVQELDEIFRQFDVLIAGNGLEKIKTIGDAYMAAAGLPLPVEDHALRCVRAAVALIRFMHERNESAAIKWGLRIGVHSGAVVAGVVGRHKYAYDVWGDTVNIASRLERASDVNRINISAYTYDQVRRHFDCEYRGKLSAKGKGDIVMYFVLRERAGIMSEVSLPDVTPA
jgi:class 3 adenylate cyclase